jgi:hypothetical protein
VASELQETHPEVLWNEFAEMVRVHRSGPQADARTTADGERERKVGAELGAARVDLVVAAQHKRRPLLLREVVDDDRAIRSDRTQRRTLRVPAQRAYRTRRHPGIAQRTRRGEVHARLDDALPEPAKGCSGAA